MSHKLVNGVQVPLTPQEIIEAEQREIEHLQRIADYEATRYQIDREKEYPPIKDIVVALLEAAEGSPAALEAIKAKRVQIKQKFPKP